jgi:hypothetical protein
MNIVSSLRITSIVRSAAALGACGGGDTVSARGGPTPIVDASGMSSFDSTTLGIALVSLPLETLGTAETTSNRLRSYYKTLLKQGGSYTPQYLDQAEFDAIVNSAMERN